MSAWKEYQVTGNRESLEEYRRECNEDYKVEDDIDCRSCHLFYEDDTHDCKDYEECEECPYYHDDEEE